jgi:hypothetical protein
MYSRRTLGIPVRGFVFDVKTGRVHEIARKRKARAAGA